MLEPRARWPYSPQEDMVVARRRYRGDTAKAIARDLGRTPISVHRRFQYLRERLSNAHADVLIRHRQEELELLERLLKESAQPDAGERR